MGDVEVSSKRTTNATTINNAGNSEEELAETKNGEIGKAKYSAPAIERAFAILELLAQERELSLSEVASRLNLNRNQVYRELNVLQQCGYVAYWKQGRLYRLSHKMFQVSHQHAPLKKLAEIATPVINSWSNQTGHNCYVIIYSQGEILVHLGNEIKPTHGHWSVPIGSTGSLTGSAGGLVILGHSSHADREEMMEDAFGRGLVENQSLDPMQTRLDEIGKSDYLIMESSEVVGIHEIAAPIFNFDNRLAGVLCVYLAKMKDQDTADLHQQIADELVEAAQRISSDFGYVAD